MAALMLLAGTYIATAQTAADFQPYQPSALRLPSVPLFVNDPYFSLWSPFDKLNDGTTRHWSDAEKAMDGLLRVDGKAYRFMGRQRTNLLKAIAPMSTGESGWTAKVNYNRQTGTGWTDLDFDDSAWATEDAAWGTANEYPNCRHNWSAQNSDIADKMLISRFERSDATAVWNGVPAHLTSSAPLTAMRAARASAGVSSAFTIIH